MCIACVKPANIAVPPMTTFENCFSVNPDGAGLAYVREGAVYIRKGLRTIDEFRSELEKTVHVLGGPNAATATPMLFHFRIGTHGSKDDPRHTHPFPLTDDYATMTELHIRTKAAVIHNGIINLGFGKASRHTNSYGYWDNVKRQWISEPASANDDPSDTMEFIKEVLSPLTDIGPWHNNPKIHTFIRNLAGQSNKIATLFDTGETLLLGDFIPGPDGLFYSNRSFETRALPTKPIFTSPNDDWSDNGYTSPALLTLDYLDAFGETAEATYSQMLSEKPNSKSLAKLDASDEWTLVNTPVDFWTTKLDAYNKNGCIGQRIMLRCPKSLWFMRTDGSQFAYFSPATGKIRVYPVSRSLTTITDDGILDATLLTQRFKMSLTHYINDWIKTNRTSWPDHTHYYWDLKPAVPPVPKVIPIPPTSP